jgi:hypothetical protein
MSQIHHRDEQSPGWRRAWMPRGRGAQLAPVLALLILASILGQRAGAIETYKCIDEKGVVLYSDVPCGTDATQISVDVIPPGDGVVQPMLRPGEIDLLEEATARGRMDQEKRQQQEQAGPKPYRGMTLRTFGLLSVGMSEAEVRYIAGAPDRETIEGVNTRLGFTRKSYYYIKEGHNASITRIRFVNGTVTHLDRDLMQTRQKPR